MCKLGCGRSHHAQPQAQHSINGSNNAPAMAANPIHHNSFAALASDDSGEDELPDDDAASSGTEGDLGAGAPVATGRRGRLPAATLEASRRRPHFDARTRLLRDAREVAEGAAQLPFISAQPSDANIFLWRVTMTAPDGRYHGVVFHAEMEFPKEYPAAPPVIRLCTDIPHPNVFSGYDYNLHRRAKGTFICLDMLKPPEGNGSYSGWSSAYSALSILLQLQSFLFGENIPQDDGKRTVRSYLKTGRSGIRPGVRPAAGGQM